MYYCVTIKDRIRLVPKLFSEELKKAIKKATIQQYEGLLIKNMGLLLSIIKISNIGEGIIFPGDGAVYYETTFDMLIWKPELQELVEGEVNEITEFGAFIKIGPIEGLVHLSQVMDDYVNYSKSGVLAGRESKRVLKTGDKVRAKIIAASLKNLQTAKIGLTMRQDNLGKLEWLKEKKSIKRRRTPRKRIGAR